MEVKWIFEWVLCVLEALWILCGLLCDMCADTVQILCGYSGKWIFEISCRESSVDIV